MTNKDNHVYGTIVEGLFLREAVGTATEPNIQGEIELSISITTSSPIVGYNGKSFILSWGDMIKLAEAAGLFDSEVVQND